MVSNIFSVPPTILHPMSGSGHVVKCHIDQLTQHLDPQPVERFVQTFKRAMRAGEKDGLPLNRCLSEFLSAYRAIPHATTGVSPRELFLRQKPRTRFDLLKPDHKRLIASRQATQKTQPDKHARLRSLPVGSLICHGS